MSTEQREWLATKVLVGNTDQDGYAWHHLKGDDNHYPGFIPIADVERRLFGWEEMIGSVKVEVITSDGIVTFDAGDMLGVVRPPKTLGEDDEGQVLAIHSSGYKSHTYRKWLLENLAILLDDELGIVAAGLLKQAKQAWVQVTTPEIYRVDDVDFQPYVLAASSLDASISTIYKRLIRKAICDNTLAAGLRELGPEVRIKHTSNSLERLAQMRSDLKLELKATADAFAAEIGRLTAKKMSGPQWESFVKLYRPVAKDAKKPTITRVARERDELHKLWEFDVRVAPWKGTAYGALAAVNTWATHYQSTRGKDRGERNLVHAVDGIVTARDEHVVAILDSVL